MTEIRRTPCPACPYRCDVPSGVWHDEEYAKLRRYDRPTGEQPPAAFSCHATPERLCHGWAVVHSTRGHAFDLLALRLLGGPPVPPAVVPLFSSGAQAADHGEQDIARPGPAAVRAIDTLRRYPRLREDAAPDPQD